mmetsp:Transcript_29125/g.84659  ORF Transcript_29125/g.84659 Transcript_29125/m.84659 type:complete len:264 (-) Transcript_29125:2940-3731(-)
MSIQLINLLFKLIQPVPDRRRPSQRPGSFHRLVNILVRSQYDGHVSLGNIALVSDEQPRRVGMLAHPHQIDVGVRIDVPRADCGRFVLRRNANGPEHLRQGVGDAPRQLIEDHPPSSALIIYRGLCLGLGCNGILMSHDVQVVPTIVAPDACLVSSTVLLIAFILSTSCATATTIIIVTLHHLKFPPDRPPKPAIAPTLDVVGIVFTNKVLMPIGHVAVVQHEQGAGFVPAGVDGPAQVGAVTTDEEDALGGEVRRDDDDGRS